MSDPTPRPDASRRQRRATTPRSGPGQTKPSDSEHVGESFRWQALFQRSSDVIFVLDAQHRLRFVNQAWEALTGLTAADVRLLSCKRRKPAAAGDSLLDVLAHVLCPPAEVLRGEFGRARRRLPASDRSGQRVWDVEFLPLKGGARVSGILGRVLPRVEVAPAAATPLPERLIDLRATYTQRFHFDLLESSSPAIRRLAEQVRLASSIAAPVLITGEQGTGKETLARLIHYRGARGETALAALDCAHVPAPAIASLLFGDGPMPGRPGAIYLREPGSLPRDLQLQLCGLIAAGSGPRILVGCRTDPGEQLRSGQLLDELFAAFPLVLEVPPLRQRLHDLPALAERILQRLGEEGSTKVDGLTPAVCEVLVGHSWPGNLRELFAALAAARRRASAVAGSSSPARRWSPFRISSWGCRMRVSVPLLVRPPDRGQVLRVYGAAGPAKCPGSRPPARDGPWLGAAPGR